MIVKPSITKLLSIICLSTGLFACGGGSGGGSNDSGRPALPPTNPAPVIGNLSPMIENQSIQIYGDTQVVAGSAAGFAIIPVGNNQIESTTWQQTAGPSLSILAQNSQTIGFDVPSVGNYSLQVSVKLQGQAANNTYSINFSASGGQQAAALRLDHTVTELAKVSLHVGVPANKTIQSVSWQQLAGPQAQNIREDEDFLFFDAPSVTSDSVIAYQANVNYTDGSSEQDQVFVTVKNVDFDVDGLFYGNNTIISEDMFAFNQNSPYKDALERCVYNNYIPNPPNCTFSQLPLIGMRSNNPSIQDVLDRTLVSHEWMGERFESYLRNSVAGPDMLMLLRGVTAVVISYDVRPSFYWVATGAIYLDARNFWQSPEERDTLNDVPDFRSDFGSALNFSVFWRYTKDNDYYPSARIPKQERIERSFADVEASISWLMYHELAHANDFFPATSWASVSNSTTPLAYFRSNGTNSDVLNNTFPLRSDEMHSLAQVRFANQTPTATEIGYRGTDVEGFFVPDIASSFYSYLTEREDFATLFERYMMLYRLGSEADVAIIDGETSSEEPLVVWGQRNRITEDSLEDRTVFTVGRVYPELGNIRGTLQNLNPPILMRANEGWFENIDISPAAPSTNGNRLRTKQDQPFSRDEIKQRIFEDTKYIHEGRPTTN